jgi:four helix bundle protein
MDSAQSSTAPSYEERVEALRQRTKGFALDALRFGRTLPRSEEASIIRRQFLRSATSVAANYRAVSRTRSRAAFVAKLDIVIEEADESAFWLELLIDAGLASEEAASALLVEAQELTRLFAAARRTALRNR